MTYKILTNKTHLIPENYFTLTKRALRKPLLLQSKRFSNKAKQNFFYRIINIWNKLPKEAMEISHSKEFREFAKVLN